MNFRLGVITLALLVGVQVMMTWRFGWRGLAAATAAVVYSELAGDVLFLASLQGYFDLGGRLGGSSLAKRLASNMTLGGFLCLLLSPVIALIAAFLLAFTVKTE